MYRSSGLFGAGEDVRIYREKRNGGAPEDAMSDEEVIREVFGTDSAPKGANAVLFTHYHGDHVGLKTRLRGTEPFSCDPKRKNVSEKRFDVADPDMYLKKGFVMLVRPNRNPDLEMGRFEQWMQPMKDPFITYSLWDGYLEDGKTPRADIVQFMKGKNDDAHRKILHTSGHAYVETLKKLMDLIEPEVIIPMHTESIEAFKSLPLFKEYKDRMTELTDGEVFPLQVCMEDFINARVTLRYTPREATTGEGGTDRACPRGGEISTGKTPRERRVGLACKIAK